MGPSNVFARFFLAYGSAVVASTVAATAGLALFGFVLRGGANVADLPEVLRYALLYSAVGIAALGPIGLMLLGRMARPGAGAHLVAGVVLGLVGGMILTGGELVLGVPFLIAGTLAGGAAALVFRMVNGGASAQAA